MFQAGLPQTPFKGIAPKKHPLAKAAGEAQVAIDCDFRSGALRPAPSEEL